MILIDFYSQHPRWLFRTSNAQTGRIACRNTIRAEPQRVVERLMQRQPVDVARFHKEQFVELFVEWQGQARQQKTPIGYDAWMDLRFLQGAESAALKQGSIVFDLIHGVVYEVRGKDGLRRVFRVQLAGDFPYVSFRDIANGIDFPWIAFPGVFTQAELMSLRRA